MNSPAPKLKLFTDPAIINFISARQLSLVFHRFDHLLAGTNLPPDPQLHYKAFCSALIDGLQNLDTLPPELVQALFEVEALADEKYDATYAADPGSHYDPNYPVSSRLKCAIYAWLASHPKQTPPATDALSASPALRPVLHSFSEGGSLGEGGSVVNSPASSAPSVLSVPSVLNSSAPADSRIAELARLSLTEYEHLRRAEALKLKMRVGALDKAVEDARELLKDNAAANAIKLRTIIPWPEPITDAPALFDQVEARFLHYLYLPNGASVAMTLWVPHTSAINCFTITPRLNFTSTEPGCGKSTALDLLATLCPKVLRTDNLKPAVLFRVADQNQPTLLLDELDSYLHLWPELRGLINAGNSPDACAIRCEGNTIRSFKAFTAIALAGIGDLAPTLRDRSIVIVLTKAPPGAVAARFDKRHIEIETTLARKIARWTQDNLAAIAACDPPLPPAAYNRLGDNWRPLFALAHLIGGHWPQRAADAFHALTGLTPAAPVAVNPAPPSVPAGSAMSPGSTGSTGSTVQSMLLSDIRAIFTKSGKPAMFSSDLLAELRALPDRPWSGPKPLTLTALARRLQAVGVRPHTIRDQGRQGRQYHLADFPAV